MGAIIFFLIALEDIPWRGIFIGLFLSGIFLVIKTVISGFGSDHDFDTPEGDLDTDLEHDYELDHDVDHDIDHDIDHDADLGDMDHDIDHDLDHDVDHDIESDVDHDLDSEGDFEHDSDLEHDVEISVDGVPKGSYVVIHRGAPFMLLLGSFFIMYGGLGIYLFEENTYVLEKLYIMTLITAVVLWVINFAWSKLFTIETYSLPKKKDLIGVTATVVYTVDRDEGIIKVDLGLPKTFRFTALPKSETDVFPSGSKVRIVGWKGNFAIVDEA